MSAKLIEVARQAVAEAQGKGAQGVRASVRRERESSVEWRDGKVDRVRESTSLTLALSLFVDGRYSAHRTSDLRATAISALVDETIATTRLLAEDPHRALAPEERYQDRHDGDLGLYDPAIEAVTAEERRRRAAALEEAARSGPPSDHIISVSTTCGDTLTEAAMVTSNGMEGEERGSSFRLYARTSVKDKEGRKPRGDWYGYHRHQDQLPVLSEVGRIATERALRDRGSAPRPSGKYPCVIQNDVVESLLYRWLSPLQGSAVQQQRSFFAGRIGKRVASKVLTLTDDPLLPQGQGSTPYDGEGMSTSTRPVIERGILRTYFLDTYYASKLKMTPTTSWLSNLIFKPGTHDLDGLIAKIDKGILITGFSGGNTNPATGDFSVGIRGQWIEGGQIAGPVSEMNLAGNHLQTWKQLREVGSDAFAYSEIRSPSLRFAPQQFSGK